MTSFWKCNACEVEGVAWHGLKRRGRIVETGTHREAGMALEQPDIEVKMWWYLELHQQQQLQAMEKEKGPVTENSTPETALPTASWGAVVVFPCPFYLSLGAHYPAPKQIHRDRDFFLLMDAEP